MKRAAYDFQFLLLFPALLLQQMLLIADDVNCSGDVMCDVPETDFCTSSAADVDGRKAKDVERLRL